jgi:LemA protein
VAFARQFYNDTVMTYNTHIEVFPTNFIATMFNFGRREFFEVKAEDEREAPQVKF